MNGWNSTQVLLPGEKYCMASLTQVNDNGKAKSHLYHEANFVLNSTV